MKLVKSILAFTIFLIPLILNSKGASGSYHFKGHAYDHNQELIRSDSLDVNYGNRSEKIYTDSNGNYCVKIRWGYACISGIRNPIRQRIARTDFNSKQIHFTYRKQKYNVKNEYKQYSSRFPSSIDTIQKNLYF